MKSEILVALLCCILGIGSQSCAHPRVREPGGTSEDTEMALTKPDEYAWQLFFFLNRQAKLGTAGEPDERKRFGELDPEAPVVWETWALSSGGDKSEVYKTGATRPVPWDKLDRTSNPFILDENVEREMVDLEIQNSQAAVLRERLKQGFKAKGARSESRSLIPLVFIPPNPDDRQEVRMNKCTFEFVVGNEMYSADGLENLLTRARLIANRSLISLSSCSKEVKAEWLPIDASQKPRYLWRQVVADGKKQIWGLVALHIITKDLPNWFWADFGHVDCESQLGACSQHAVAATTIPSDITTRGPNGIGPAGSNGIRRETEGTVWANYILRGTETDFTSATGSAKVLSNPVIEATFQKSSCMSCHARAAVGARMTSQGSLMPGISKLSQPIGNDGLGVPGPSLFGDAPDTSGDDVSGFGSHTINFLQTDFMWSPVFRANRRKQASH